MRLDGLGPMIVNSDGTISRIVNWGQFTDNERKNAIRLLLKRNKLRFAELAQNSSLADDTEKGEDQVLAIEDMQQLQQNENTNHSGSKPS
jgi:hypothetical protein